MEELRGYVSDLIYRNEENGYTVFEVTTDGDTMTCTGVIPKIALGESCKVEGDYVLHPLYGQQFKASSYETVRPEGKDALVRYLAGSGIKGIGEKMAQKIADTFGDDTLRILDEEPERLAEIRGISESMARKIAVQAAGQRQERETCLFLAKYDITGPLAIKIFKTYGEKTQEILKTDPYQLADDIDGIGFVRADEIARKTGIAPGSDFRIRSGIEYVLSCALDEGSTCVPKDEVLKRAQELLEVPEDVIDIQLTNLMLDHRVVAKTKDVSGTDVPFVFLARSFRTEQRIAVHLRDLDVMTPERLTKEEIREKILAIEQQEKITLDDLQRKAVQEAAGGRCADPDRRPRHRQDDNDQHDHPLLHRHRKERRPRRPDGTGGKAHERGHRVRSADDSPAPGVTGLIRTVVWFCPRRIRSHRCGRGDHR